MSLILAVYLACISIVFIFLFALDLNGMSRSSGDSWNLRGNYKPRALVMVPCRGEEPALYENLVAVKSQRYKDYKLVAVIDDDDPALGIVRKLGIAHMRPSQKFTKCSDKVKRIASAISAMRNYDAYVILDSDEKVGEDWLARLVAPLADPRVGISVMFPLFRPLDRSFWSKMKEIWGFVGQSLLESRRTRFAAGGSMAFRKELLDKSSFKFLTGSKYSISDDISLNLIAIKKGLLVAYDAEYHPVTYVRESSASFFEWANRQTALSIFAYRRIFYYGVAYYSAEVLVFLTGIIGALAVSPFLLVLLFHFASSAMRNISRTKERDAAIIAITAAMPFLYLANLLIASRMRSITWRGITYRFR